MGWIRRCAGGDGVRDTGWLQGGYAALNADTLPRSGFVQCVLCRHRHKAHWSGHKSRLDRDLKNRFGSRNYAAEELIAELGGAFLCAEFGFDGDVRSAGILYRVQPRIQGCGLPAGLSPCRAHGSRGVRAPRAPTSTPTSAQAMSRCALTRCLPDLWSLPAEIHEMTTNTGAPDTIRTCDLCLPRAGSLSLSIPSGFRYIFAYSKRANGASNSGLIDVGWSDRNRVMNRYLLPCHLP